MNIEDLRELVQQYDSLERNNKNLLDMLWNQEVRYEKKILELSNEMASLLCKHKIAIDNLQLISTTWGYGDKGPCSEGWVHWRQRAEEALEKIDKVDKVK